MKQVREVLVRQTVVNLHRSPYLLNTPSQFGFDQFLYYKTIYDLLATRLSWRKVSGPKQREVKRFLKILTLLIFQLNAMPSWIVLLLLLETAKCMLSKVSNFIYNTPRLWHLAKDLHDVTSSDTWDISTHKSMHISPKFIASWNSSKTKEIYFSISVA